MIAELLVRSPWLAPLVLAVMVLLGPVVGAWAVDRPRLARWLAGASLVPLAALTLVPTGRRSALGCTVQLVLPVLGRVEPLANVALFVAPVLLAGVATRRPVRVVLAASALSASIETLQALVVALGRSCDTSDWVSNTLGAVTGGVLAWLGLALTRRGPWRSRPRPAGPSGGPSTPPARS